jgi:hypothetical protein
MDVTTDGSGLTPLLPWMIELIKGPITTQIENAIATQVRNAIPYNLDMVIAKEQWRFLGGDAEFNQITADTTIPYAW